MEKTQNMEYIDYIKEIERLRADFKLSAYQALTLQLAAAFKVGDISYNKLVEEFCNGKEITKDINTRRV